MICSIGSLGRGNKLSDTLKWLNHRVCPSFDRHAIGADTKRMGILVQRMSRAGMNLVYTDDCLLRARLLSQNQGFSMEHLQTNSVVCMSTSYFCSVWSHEVVVGFKMN